MSELDVFGSNFNKPIIAITGTLGKTSVTHLLTKLFCMQGIRASAAGNIGLGMCDLLLHQDEVDLVVLEVSSFQLEQSTLLKPNISIWTNFYPNHLDRHHDIKSYFDAKFMIMSKQDKLDNALLPFSLINEVYKNSPACKINFFTTDKVDLKDFDILRQGDSLFFIENNNIYLYPYPSTSSGRTDRETDREFEKYNKPVRGELVEPYGYPIGAKKLIYSLKDLPEITFIENWLIICVTFHLYKTKLNIDMDKLDIPEHRLEKFATQGDIEFYNDSKSTVSESTLAAVSKFKADDLILFLGGLSKGVDRSVLVSGLKTKVKTIICFGAEAEQLKRFCDLNSISAYKSNTLEEAINICMNIIDNKDKVLFSPAGSSYDLFSNYQERGKAFKQLINLQITNNS